MLCMCLSFSCQSDDEDVQRNPAMYLVSHCCLLQLLHRCPDCSRPCAVEETRRMGTMLTFRQQCFRCHFNRSWSTQPMVTNIPAGNLSLSAAIAISAASPAKVLRLLSFMNIPAYHISTYINHCRLFIYPTVYHFWLRHQNHLLHTLAGMAGGLQLAGDARSDSPGHSAKYTSYTMMETRLNKVIDIQLVQVRTFISL